MSFSTGAYPQVDMTAPDADRETQCPGCSRLMVQISNQAVFLTFGVGYPPMYGQPERVLPVVGSIARQFDAFKVRAATPTAQLPAGATQAHVSLTPVQ